MSFFNIWLEILKKGIILLSMLKKNNKKIIVGGILATVLAVAALSASSTIAENTNINILGNETASTRSGLVSSRATEADVDAIFAPWTFTELPGGVGFKTSGTIDWASKTNVEYAYIDIYNSDTAIRSTIDITGKDSVEYYFIEDGTYTMTGKITFTDGETVNASAPFIEDMAGTTADSAIDSLYEPWVSSFTEIKEGADTIGFTTTSEVDLSGQSAIKSVFIEVKDGGTLVDRYKIMSDGTEDKTLEYYFTADGTYDVSIRTETVNGSVFNTSLKTGLSVKSVEGVVGGILDDAAASLEIIDDSDYTLVDPSDVGNIGYKITGAPVAADYEYIDQIYVVESTASNLTPIYHSVNSTGIEYFTYDDSVELDFEVFLANGQTISKDITSTDINSKDVRKDISLIYENVNSAMTVDKSGVTINGTADLPSFVASSEIELENGEGTVLTTPYSTVQEPEGYTFNFTDDDDYRLVAHTTLNNNTGSGDTSMGTADGDDVYDTIIKDIDGATMIDWVTDSGEQDGFHGYRSKQEDVENVFAPVIAAITPINGESGDPSSVGATRIGFSVDAAFAVDPELTFSKSELLLYDFAGNEVNIGDITTDINNGTIAKEYYFNSGLGYDVDSTYKLVARNTLDSGAIYDVTLFGADDYEQGYILRTEAEATAIYKDLVFADSSSGFNYGITGTGSFDDTTSWLASTEFKLISPTGGNVWPADALTGSTINLAYDYLEDGTYTVQILSTAKSGQIITYDAFTTQGWVDRTSEIDSYFDTVVLTPGTYQETMAFSDLPALDATWASNYNLIVKDPSGKEITKDSSSTADQFDYTMTSDGTYTYQFVIDHNNGDTYTTTEKTFEGYRLRDEADMAASYDGLKAAITFGNFNSSVIINGPVDLTDDKITGAEILLFNDDSTDDASATPIETYTLFDGKTAAPTTADHTFNIPADDNYHVVARQTYENGQTLDYTLVDPFDGYEFRDQADVDALYTDFAYTQPSNLTEINITGTMADEAWVTSSKIQLLAEDGSLVEEKDLAPGAIAVDFTSLDDAAKYTINIHTVLTSGEEFDSSTIISDTITGYTLRTQDDVNAIYLDTDGTSFITWSMGAFSKDITFAGTLTLPTWLESSTISILDSTDTVVYTSAAPLTATVDETYAFLADDTYSVIVNSTLTNGDTFTTEIATGIEGYADRNQTVVDAMYASLVAELSAVADGTPAAGTTIDNSEEDTEMKISGTVTLEDWVATSTLSIIDSTGAVVDSIDLTKYDETTGHEFAFTKDDTYKVKIDTELNNGNTFETWLMGDATTPGEQGYVYHGPDVVGAQYEGMTSALVDEATKTDLGISGTVAIEDWTTSSVLNLTRTDVVDSTFDQTEIIDGTWTGTTFNFPEDGTYKLTLTSTTNNNGQYTIDLGTFDGLAIRDTSDITAIYSGLANTLGAVDTTNGEAGTNVTVAGEVTMPTWVKSAELQLIKGADATGTIEGTPVNITAGGPISSTFEFQEDAEYIINVHTVLNNGMEQDDQIGTNITGYKTRTENDVKAEYPLKIDSTTDTTNKTVTVNDIPTTKPSFISKAQLEVYSADDAELTTMVTSANITNNATGSETLTYGQDGTFKIVMNADLANGANYRYVLTGGDSLTGWGEKDQATEIDPLYDGITVDYDIVNAAVDTDTVETNTAVTIGGSAAALPEWVNSAEIQVFQGADIATGTSIGNIVIGSDGTFAGDTIAFPADDNYIVNVHTILSNKDEYDTELANASGFLAHDKTTVESETGITGLTVATDPVGSATIKVTGDYTTQDYIASGTFTLKAEDGTEVETVDIPDTWDPSTGVSFAPIKADGKYDVDANITLNNGAIYGYSVATGIFAFVDVDASIDAVFDTLTGATSTEGTSFTLSGELTLPEYVDTATLSISDSAGEVASLDMSTYSSTTGYEYIFATDDTYSALIDVTLTNGYTYTYQPSEWAAITGYKEITSVELDAAYGALVAEVENIEDVDGSIVESHIKVSGALGDVSSFKTSTIVLHRTDDATGTDDLTYVIDATAWDPTEGYKFSPTVDGEYEVYITTELINASQTDTDGSLAKYAVTDTNLTFHAPKDESEILALFNNKLIGKYINDPANPLANNSKFMLDWSTIDLPTWAESVKITMLGTKTSSSYSKVLGTIDGTTTDSGEFTFESFDGSLSFESFESWYALNIEITLAEGTIITGDTNLDDNLYTVPFEELVVGTEGWEGPESTGGATYEFEGWKDLSSYDDAASGVYSGLELVGTENGAASKLELIGKVQANNFITSVNAKVQITKDGITADGKTSWDLTTEEFNGTTDLDTRINVTGTPDPDATYSILLTTGITDGSTDGERGTFETTIEMTPLAVKEALDDVKYGYSENSNELTVSGDIKKSDVENVDELSLTIFKDGKVYAVKTYNNTFASRNVTVSSDSEYIHIEESFKLTETGNYSLKVTTKTKDGSVYSVSKGSQVVEEIKDIESNNPKGLGAFGIIAIISIVAILPLLVALAINKLKEKK